MVARWDDEGEFDLLDWFAELTIYTSSSCLVGKRFRDQLTGRFAELYHDLERGTDALAFVDPYAPIESFRRRDEARVEMVGLIQAIMDERLAAGPLVDEVERDLLDVLMSIEDDKGAFRFSADQVTGVFISMMFAGHHTTSTTASWMIIELLKRPGELAKVIAELDGLYENGEEVSYQALRAMPLLEASLMETLRLHPPLILLLRVAKEDIEFRDLTIQAGEMVGASPWVSGRIPEDFADAERFDSSRYIDPRQEVRLNPWTWIPFGAGRHRCVGSAFALMQMKAIFSVLFEEWEFKLSQPAEDYVADLSKMVIQLKQPCVVQYRRRDRAKSERGA